MFNIKRYWQKPNLVMFGSNRVKCCAYVGIHTVSAHEVSVLKKVRKIKDATEAFRVYGIYDILVKLKTKSKCALEKIVDDEINCIKGVRGTSTMFIKPKEPGEMIKFQIPSPVIVAASKQ